MPGTSSDGAVWMKDYYQKIHDAALRVLRDLTGDSVEDTVDGVNRAIQKVKRQKDFPGIGKIRMAARCAWFDWRWSWRQMQALEAAEASGEGQ